MFGDCGVRVNIGFVLGLVGLLTTPALGASHADFVGRFLLTQQLPYFGGFSGLEFRDDGQRFVTLSDSAALVSGRVERDPAGAITNVVIDGPPTPLTDINGVKLTDPEDDSEGLALAPDGGLYISFEIDHRVVHYQKDGANPQTLPVPEEFAGLEENGGLEGLAIAADGTLFALVEGDPQGAPTVPVFRFRNGIWDRPFDLPEDGTWRAVGADFGADGRLYVLERDFWPFLGFMSRLRRFELGETGIVSSETLMTSRAGRHGNLEGLSMWQDRGGTQHATMISDNNFLAIQSSEFVDYAIRD